MSKSSFAKTYEDVQAHIRTLVERLAEDEEYRALEERARAAGYALTVTHRYTASQEFAADFVPLSDEEGKLPHGFAAEIWFDINRGDKVLAFCDEDGNVTQCSYSMTVATAESYFLFTRVRLYSYEEMMRKNQLIAILGDDLDGLETYGATASPFTRDALTPLAPRGEEGLLRGIAAVGEGSYVEIITTEDDHETGHENAYYFSTDAFLPYRMILLSIVGAERLDSGTSLTLDEEETERFVAALEEAGEAIHSVDSFSDALSDTWGVTSFAPPPRLESCLNRLTLLRSDEFLSDCADLAAYLTPAEDAAPIVTFIW